MRALVLRLLKAIHTLWVGALCASLGGCAYLGTTLGQMNYWLQQSVSPSQRVYKHMLKSETFFVFGSIGPAGPLNPEAFAVVAVSDKFHNSEVVEVNHFARPGSYYSLDLPAGDYRLLAVSDLDRNGYYDENEVLGSRDIALTADAIPDQVLGGIDIGLATRPDPAKGSFRIDVVNAARAADSIFFPGGTIRSLDDPIFAPQIAALGMYDPSAFREAAPMMFYALEEDLAYKIPVVFVHGYGGGGVRDFAGIVARLDRSRFKPWFFYYPSGTDLHKLGAIFYKIFLAGPVILPDGMPMVIVAHSMGGLVVREALNLYSGAKGENRVRSLITISSPLSGDPAARGASNAPVVVPSWRDLSPDSEFIAGLYRKALPADLEYHLMFSYGDTRTIKLGANSDGVVSLASQLKLQAWNEARDQHGFDDTHDGILKNREAIDEIARIIAQVHAPFPESQLQEMVKGGFRVNLGPQYTPLEAFYIHNQGFFMEAITSGALAPVSRAQRHFLRASRGEVAAASAIETAWIKFSGEYPDRRVFTN